MLTDYRVDNQFGQSNQSYNHQGVAMPVQTPEDAQFRTCSISSRLFASGKVYLSVNLYGRQRLC